MSKPYTKSGDAINALDDMQKYVTQQGGTENPSRTPTGTITQMESTLMSSAVNPCSPQKTNTTPAQAGRASQNPSTPNS